MKNTVKKMIAAVVLALVAGGVEAPAAEKLWIQDIKEAKKKAAQEKKDLLLNFTGSDWCGWCVKLDREVFDQSRFVEEVPKQFVLVEIDYPRGKVLPDDIRAQNEKLKKEFEIPGFPTIYLADAQGRPYAQTGYQEGGEKNYMKYLAEMRKIRIERDKHFKAAKKKDIKPLEKAKLLDKALDLIDPKMVDKYYRVEIKQIMELDAENKAGLKLKYELKAKLQEARIIFDRGDLKGTIAKLEAIIKEMKPTGEAAQEVYYFLSESWYGNQDKAKAHTYLKKALQAAPESEMAKRIKEIIEQYFTE